jgi:hypothetical protein
MSERVAKWTLAMHENVERWRHKPLSFGDADCFQFLAEHVLAITGREYRDRFPQYASRDEAESILDATGGPAALLTSCLGEPKPVAWAMEGDAVLCDFGDGPAAAVCLGVYCCAPGPRGLRFQITADAVAAWSV